MRIGIEKFQDIKVADVIEAFKIEKLEPACLSAGCGGGGAEIYPLARSRPAARACW